MIRMYGRPEFIYLGQSCASPIVGHVGIGLSFSHWRIKRGVLWADPSMLLGIFQGFSKIKSQRQKAGAGAVFILTVAGQDFSYITAWEWRDC